MNYDLISIYLFLTIIMIYAKVKCLIPAALRTGILFFAFIHCCEVYSYCTYLLDNKPAALQ